MELPHTLYTGMCSVSLLILIPQNVGFFWCEEVLYKTIHSVPKNNKVIFFFVPKPLSKSVTTMILRHIVHCIAHYRPYSCTLWPFGGHCSVIFILNPYSREELFQKSCKSLVISVCPVTHPLTISNLTI